MQEGRREKIIIEYSSNDDLEKNFKFNEVA